ncbi:Integral membrane protein [Microbacterium esteraromaticum]|uniref:Integral membrane protein n=1 Tax=Microbacterium esteraromaticum TaxID=57043 RepID=A0A1R4JGC0_9MICO|nr:DUF4129 domain-containing protein [Microbacterium esteraromaticum]SJN30845.1 Integral membrane protein [Microbacterium esteraromaticum]
MIALPAVFIPDGDEARQWAQDELSKSSYQAAKPTWFDQMIANVIEWFMSLFSEDGAGSTAPVAITVVVIVVIAALVVALLVWGRPRASRAVRRRADLLGERDDRTAAQLRAEAERCVKEGDWDGAVILRFRALARSLLERDQIDPAPGATAQGIAREAAGPFPGFSDRLHAAATSFDAVRYLRSPASESDYRELAAADDALRSAAPAIPASAPQAVLA